MPYNHEWDEEVPQGAITPANTLDDIIIAVKEAIRERIDDVIPLFANDGINPKVIKIPGGEVLPERNPHFDGEPFIVWPELRLYAGRGGVWRALGGTSGGGGGGGGTVGDPPEINSVSLSNIDPGGCPSGTVAWRLMWEVTGDFFGYRLEYSSNYGGWTPVPDPGTGQLTILGQGGEYTTKFQVEESYEEQVTVIAEVRVVRESDDEVMGDVASTTPINYIHSNCA